MPTRYYTLVVVLFVFIASLILEVFFHLPWVTWPIMVVSGVLSLVGLRDVTQSKQAIRRNYPIIAHFRFLFEYIRPEIRQYFIESENEANPFEKGL